MDMHIPTRTCVVTREKLPKNMLVRIGIEDSKLVVDTTGKIRSRGINIKPDIEILKQAIKRNIFKRVYNKTFTKEEYSELERQFEEYVDTKYRTKETIRVSKSDIDKLDKE